MRLADVASYFSKDPAVDAYTSAALFNVSTSYEDERGANASGPAGRHFLMTVKSGTVLPGRRAVTIFGDTWLIGLSNPDGYRGNPISQDYIIRKATDLLQVLSPAQACLSASGTPVYIHKEYLRDNSNTVTDSGLNVFWNIFLALGETLGIGSFLRDSSGNLFHVRNLYSTAEGFQVAEADGLPLGALKAVQFTANGAYVPITDSFTAQTVNTYAIEIDVPNAYVFHTSSESTYRAGDKALIVPASALTPVVGATLLMGGKTYKLETVTPQQDAFLTRARLA